MKKEKHKFPHLWYLRNAAQHRPFYYEFVLLQTSCNNFFIYLLVSISTQIWTWGTHTTPVDNSADPETLYNLLYHQFHVCPSCCGMPMCLLILWWLRENMRFHRPIDKWHTLLVLLNTLLKYSPGINLVHIYNTTLPLRIHFSWGFSTLCVT